MRAERSERWKDSLSTGVAVPLRELPEEAATDTEGRMEVGTNPMAAEVRAADMTRRVELLKFMMNKNEPS